MKVELQNNDGYHFYAYFEPATHPKGYYNLRITTQWETAKNPTEEQTKLNMLLSPDALNNLRQLIK